MAIGTVTHVNPHNGMFIIAIDSGDHVVFENLSSTEVSVGDRIRGDLEALGGEELAHLGERETFSAFGQTGPSSLQACLRVAAG
jgi:hypothetical protein